jgi:hypothetical protein
MASLAQRLTQARRILVVHTVNTGGSAGIPAQEATPSKEERFVGQLSTSVILSTISPKSPALGAFETWLQGRAVTYNDMDAEIHELLQGWYSAFKDTVGAHRNEEAAKVVLTAELLRRWFGDAMLKEPMRIADLERASAVDLLRLLDYPNDYVPVLTRREPALKGSLPPKGQPAERVDVVDKVALNARLARSYLVELLDRARIA